MGFRASNDAFLLQMVFKKAMNFPSGSQVRVREWPLSPSMLLCCVKCWQTSGPRPSGSDLEPRTSPSPYEARGFFCLKKSDRQRHSAEPLPSMGDNCVDAGGCQSRGSRRAGAGFFEASQLKTGVERSSSAAPSRSLTQASVPSSSSSGSRSSQAASTICASSTPMRLGAENSWMLMPSPHSLRIS